MFNPRKNITLDALNGLMQKTLASQLGMEVISVNMDSLTVKMPVDERTIQSYGVLNGGASMALAETCASLATNLCLDEDKMCVGLEINGNHIRAISSGYVYGTPKPIHIGRTTHVWEIRITDDRDKLINLSRITLAIMNIKS